MPYYVGVGDPEWDEYMKMVEDGDAEPPISLFKYVEPWAANTTVLQFPETPGPQPQDKNADPDPQLSPPQQWRARFDNEQKFASDLALWKLSSMTDPLWSKSASPGRNSRCHRRSRWSR